MSDVRMDEEKTFGGCEGPDAMYVKLISSDGHEFIVKRDHALTSGTIKAMLSGPGKNSYSELTFLELRSRLARSRQPVYGLVHRSIHPYISIGCYVCPPCPLT